MTPFRLPNDPGDATVYVCPVVTGEAIEPPPLTRAEQARINVILNCQKRYFLSMQNIERACFTALNSSINNALKLSNIPGVRGRHAGMRVIDMLNQ